MKTSAVEGGGEGLYARRRLRKGEIFAFYNGVRKEGRDSCLLYWVVEGRKGEMVAFYNVVRREQRERLPSITC